MNPQSLPRRQGNRSPRSFTLRPISVAACLLGAAPLSFGLPQGAVPSFGQTTVRTAGPGLLNITQTTPRAGLDWSSFSIAAGERVVISQPGSSSVLLNRVLGNDPSAIYGSLQANGSVWLVNPRGIVFGENSRVDVGSLLATTLGIDGDAFASGRLVLGRGAGTPGELRSEGQITAHAGSVVLASPLLTHSGHIDARRVALVAATDVQLDVEGDGLIVFNARNDGSLDTRLRLLGQVVADGGSVEASAAARAGFADTVLNLDGVVQARSIGQRHGRIVIDGGSDGITAVGGRIDASGMAAGETGGAITVLGQKIGLASRAVIDASGAAGGGTVLVGGDFQGKNPDLHNAEMVTAQQGARLDVSATQAGDGGKLIVWSDAATRFAGAADARGGAAGGDGGFVEVSGKQNLAFTGTSDRSAPLGVAGTLLLDPKSLLIQDATPDVDGGISGGTVDIADGDLTGGTFTFAKFAAADPSIITKAGVAALTGGAGGALTLQASDTITVAAGADLTRASGLLTLQAGGNITVNANITASGGLSLLANDAGGTPANGRVVLASGITLDAGSSTLTLSNGAGSGVHDIRGNLSAGTLAVTGTVALTGTSTWTLSGTSTDITTVINGAGSLTKDGVGTLTLTGTKSYTGTTTVVGGTLALGSDNVLANGSALVVSGGTLDIGTRSDIVASVSLQGGSISGSTGVLTSTAALDLQSGSASAILASANGADKTTVGTVTLSGANTYTGTTTVSGGGTLSISGSTATAGASAGGITLNNGTLDIANGASIGKAITLSNVAGNAISSSAGGGTLATNATDLTIPGSRTLTLSAGSGSTLSLNRVIAGGGSASAGITGAGIVALSQTNTYGGGTTVSGGGTLRLVATATAGDSGSGLTLNDGTLDLNNGASYTKALTLTGDNAIVASGTGGTLAAGTALVLDDLATLSLGSSAGSLTVARGIGDGAGSAAVAVTTGTVIVSAATTYDGGTGVANGALLRLSGGSASAGTGAITLASGATLDLLNASVANAITSNGGAISNSSGTATLSNAASLTLGDASTTTLSGAGSGLAVQRAVTDGADTGAITVASGSVTFSANNSYDGTTTISAGTLAIGAGGTTGTLGTGAVTNNGTLAFNRSNALTVANDIDGTGALSKSGAGILTLTGANSYSGTTTISAGTLAVGAGGTIGTLGSGAVTNNATLSVDRSDDLTLANAISGTGALAKSGAGILTLTGANSYSGTTTISAGTLAVGAGGATGTLGTGAVTNDATLSFNRNNALTVASAIGGTGDLSKSGAGTLTLTGTNTYDGTTTINAGTLAIGSGGTTGTLGDGAVTNNATLSFNRSNALTVANDIGGTGALGKSGAGILTLTGANSYSGTTTISAGTLAVGAGGTIGTLGGGAVTNNGTLSVNRSDDLTLANAIGGTGALGKSGAGVLTLTGANTYSGTTTINAGTLAIGAGGSTGAIGTGAVTNNATLAFNRSDDLTVASDIGGTGNLGKSGAGILTLTGTNSYDGTTTISAGTLAIGSGGATGTLGDGAVTNDGVLVFNRSGTLAVANTIGGSGSVEQIGSGTTVLSSANGYLGATTIDAGTLRVTGSGTAGSGAGAVVTLNAGTLDIAGGASIANDVVVTGSATISSSSGNGTLTAGTALSLPAASTLTLDGGTGTLTLARGIDEAGASAALIVSGGNVVLGADNGYTGTTTISAGSLTVGTGGTTGTLGAGAVTNNGTLAFNRSDDLTWANAIGGTGALSKSGAGTLTLTGANTYSGTTTVSAGTLAVGAGGTIGTLGTGAVTNDATLSFNRSNALTVANAISGTGNVSKSGGSTLTLIGTNSYDGTTTINAGTLAIGNGGATGTLGDGAVTNDAALSFNRSNALTVANAIGGTGNVSKSGAGTLTLTGTNTYDGTTTINAGTLTVGSGGTTGTLGDGAVTNNATLSFNRSNALTVANDIGGTGALGKSGAGILTLTGANSYSGTTTISAGTLAVGAGGTIGTLGTGAVTNNGTLSVNRSDDLTLANAIGGTGALSKFGAGILTLTGANSYSGTTTINAGTLAIGDGGSTGAIGTGAVTNNATLAFNRSDDLTVASDIGGTGNLGQSGAGRLTLTGTNSYDGTTTISAGTLAIGSGGATGTLGDGAVTNDGVLVFNRSGTLAVANAIGGSGSVEQIGSGTTTLGADNGYAGTTLVSGGVLQIGNAGTTGTLGGGAVTVNAATLRFTRSDDITLAKDIAGTGNFAHTGTGTLTLTGANSYAGSTTIGAGTLAVGAGGTTGTLGGGAVTNNGTLSVNRSDDLTLANAIGGTGALAKSGAGVLTLTGANTYSGTTTISAGTLAIGAGGSTGAIGTGAVTNNATLAFNRSDDVGVANTIGGSGNVLLAGTGRSTLTGANSYAGGTSVSAGTLALSGAGTAGSGDISLAAGTVLDISNGAEVANAVNSAGATVSNDSGAGTLSGSLTLTASSTLASAGTGLLVSGVIGDGAGTFGITKTGSGSVTLSATNLYGGATLVTAGTLATAGADVIDDSSAVDVATGATLRLGGSDTIGSLRGGGSVDLGANALVAGGDGSSTAFSGLMGGSGGAFTKAGSGTLTLSGSHSYSGATRVAGGTLALSGDDRLADASAVSVDTGATLQLGGNDTVASLSLAGTLTGSGTLTGASYTLASGNVGAGVNLGAGTLSSSGVSVLDGSAAALTVNIAADSLTLGSAERLAAGATVTVAGGATLALNGNQTLTTLDLSGTASGSGTLTATDRYTLRDGAVAAVALGGGLLESTGATRIENTAAATTINVDSGTLTLGSASRLGGGASTVLTIASAATMALGGDESIGTLNLSGSLDGSGTLSAASYALTGGTVAAGANLGTGTLSSTGTSRLDGSAAAGTVTVSSGTLTLGAAERLADTADVTVAAPSSGAGTTRLVLNGDETVASLALSGRLEGTGTLTATDTVGYLLNGGLAVANLGTGQLESRGSSRIDGTVAANTVSVLAGTLTLGAADRLADTARVVVSGAGTVLNLLGTDTVDRLAVSGGSVTGATLTAANYELSGGTYDSPLGAGALVSTGNSTLSNTAAATSVLVEDGSLTLVGGGLLTGTPVVTVNANAALNLGGTETVASLSLNGSNATLGGSGTLNAASYTLHSGIVGVGVALGSGVLTSTGTSQLFGTAAAETVTVQSEVLSLQGVNRLAGGAVVTVTDGATLALNGNTTVGRLLLAGTVQGSGTLTAARYELDGGQVDANLGTGVFTSTGASAVSATVGAGTVDITSGSLSLASAERLADSATVTVTGGSTLLLNGAETVGRLVLGDATLGRGTLGGSGSLNAATYAMNGGTVDAAAALGSGALSSSGSSQLDGSAAVDSLSVASGTLSLGSAGRLSALPATEVAGGATLVLGGNEALGTLAGSGNVALGAATLTTGDGGDSSFDGVIAGSGQLVKRGAGVFNVDGAQAYVGRTTVEAGRLVLGATLASAEVVVSGGTLVLTAPERLADSASLAVASTGTLTLAGSERVDSLALSGTLDGSGTLSAATYALDGGRTLIGADLGSGALTSQGSSALGGLAAVQTLRVGDGTLSLGSAGRLTALPVVQIDTGAALALGGNETLGTLAGNGTLALGAATLSTGVGGPSSFAGVIEGSGGLVKQGGDSFTLSGVNAYTGNTVVEAGTLALAAAERLNAATVLSVASGASLTLAGDQHVASLLLQGTLGGSGTLTGATYTLDSGTVASGAALGLGTLSSSGVSVLDGSAAALTVNIAADSLTLGSAERLAAGATVTVAGGATLALNGNQTLTTLDLTGTASGSGTLTATDRYTLRDGAVAAVALGGGLLESTGATRIESTAAATTVNVDSGTLTLGSASRLSATPALTVAAGATLALGGNETLGSLAGNGTVALGAATMNTGVAGPSTFGGVVEGAGSLVKQGDSRFALAGANTYTGSTLVEAGTLALAGSGRLADASAVTVASGATLDLAGNDTVASLLLRGALSGSGTLSAASYALEGGRTEADASLGAGTLSSRGASSLAGVAAAETVTVLDGTLSLASAGRLTALPAATVAAGAALSLGGDETLGTLAGNGTVALGAATLRSGVGGSSSFAGVIDGSGGLTKQGSGSSFTLAGANTYSGSTVVEAGTLALASANRLDDASAVTVATGAALNLAGDDTVASLLLRGTLGGSGTLSAASYTLESGRADADLGRGTLRSSGSSTLAGSAAAANIGIDGGTLTLAAGNRLADTAAVSVARGATLRLNGDDRIGTLALLGTLGGAGTLSNADTVLDGGSVAVDARIATARLESRGNSRLVGSADAGEVTVASGTLTLASALRLEAAPAVTVLAGSTLQMQADQTLGSLAGAGTVDLGTASVVTLTSGDAASTSFSGVITGIGNLVKQGSGSFTLTGANTYTGLTTVAAGTLVVGDGATSGSIANTEATRFVVEADAVLRYHRSDAVVLQQRIGGAGTFEQDGSTSGTLTLQNTGNDWSGPTRVLSGTLATSGSERLPDASDLSVAAGAHLVLGGAETLKSLDVDLAGDIVIGGDLETTGAMRLGGAARAADSGLALTLKGATITAVNADNAWGSRLSLITTSGAMNIAAGSASDELVLGTVTAANGGRIDGQRLTLGGDLTVNGGTLSLVASAPQVAVEPDADLLGRVAPNLRQIAYADDVVVQQSDTRIVVAEGATLAVVADQGGSVKLLGRSTGDLQNSFLGQLAVRSGGDFAAWNTAVPAGATYAVQSRVQVNGSQVRIGSVASDSGLGVRGIEADVVEIRADRLLTAPGAVIAARLPYSNLLEQGLQLPALTLALSDTAFTLTTPFGDLRGDAIAIDVGSLAWGGRSLLADANAGFIGVLPRGAAQGSTVVVLQGPAVGSYAFFSLGSGNQTEIPVFYNGVLPQTPQVQGSIAATVAVSESARKERFEEAVRTENVAVRLRAGVIAEVGPGRPATVGTEGARPPASCAPAGTTLGCAASQ